MSSPHSCAVCWKSFNFLQPGQRTAERTSRSHTHTHSLILPSFPPSDPCCVVLSRCQEGFGVLRGGGEDIKPPCFIATGRASGRQWVVENICTSPEQSDTFNQWRSAEEATTPPTTILLIPDERALSLQCKVNQCVNKMQ